MGLAIEAGDRLDDRADVGGARGQGGHAREARELLHQPLQAVDLLDDDLRALADEALRLAALPGQPPAQALGGELDRGERVLDLVGEALGDLAPGRLPLGLDQLGEVVEDEDRASVAAVRTAQGGGRGEERQAGARLLPGELGGHGPDLGPPSPPHQGDDLAPLRAPEDLLEQPADAGLLGQVEHAGRGAVDGGEAPERVEGDHAAW